MISREDNHSWHSRLTLLGKSVTLIPLGPEHAQALFLTLGDDDEIWRYIPTPRPKSVEEMQEWIAISIAAPGRRPFAVIHNPSGKVVGSTSYVNSSPADRHLDIGWTWYAREHWRTGVNTECKYLLLRYAFETLQCIRVQLRVDERNIRSQTAVERLGCKREGVLRKVQLLYDGHQRNVVIFSMLDDEWPSRKSWFEERLS